MGRLFSVKNFGCRTSQSDGAAIAADLESRGLRQSHDHLTADLVVVNTCTVTAEADRDARSTIRRIRRSNPDSTIVVTGCYAQRDPHALKAIEGVDIVVGNSHKHRLGGLVAPPLVQIEGTKPANVPYHGQVQKGGVIVGDIRTRQVLDSASASAQLGRSRPNVKVQDGCDNRCAFCVIPAVRGRSRSAPGESVVREIRRMQRRYPEVVLTGINLGRWGRDLNGRPRLAALVRRILTETEVRRVRLSSVEPMDWSKDLLDLVASSPRIADHVHVPLQSGSDAVLGRMRRCYRSGDYASRVRHARAAMPDAAIGADVMVGFPGETESEFEETRLLVERLPLTYLHVFPYSPRDGTEAATLGRQIPKAVKRQRSRILRELIRRKNFKFREGLLGRTVSAVALGTEQAASRALTTNFVQIDLSRSVSGAPKLLQVRVDTVADGRTVGLPVA